MSHQVQAPSASAVPVAGVGASSVGTEGAGGPTAIGRYLVLNLVGRGAMGEVYAAYDPQLERKIAIKVLRGKRGDGTAAAEGRARMMREAQAIAKLSHPNVVVVHDVGSYNDQVFVAMEFVDGHTLWYWMHAQPRLWQDVLKIFADAGRGLAAAHEKDLVHRDFKPENVMIAGDGQVRVMDFGLARTVGAPAAAAPVPPTAPSTDTSQSFEPESEGNGDAPAPRRPQLSAPLPVTPATDPGDAALAPGPTLDSEDLLSTRDIGATQLLSASPSKNLRAPSSDSDGVNLTRTGTILGTPAYMSPEQFQGRETDPRTDQFSFCVALYEALYGERPFPGNTPQALEASILQEDVRDPPAKSEVPPWVRKLLLRGLRPNADDRWPSMKALLTELDKNRLFAHRRRFAESAAAKLNEIWPAPVRGRGRDSDAKKEMRASFLATGKLYAAATFETVSAILDHYARSWSDMYVDICQATHVRGEQSADVLDLRMACLMDMRERLRALCTIFRQANAEVVENAVTAANALANVERCADLEFLRSAVKPPEDQATRTAVTQLRARLAEVRVLWQVGRLNDAISAVVALEPEIRALGYIPLLAELLLVYGKILNERRQADDAAVALEEALWTSELCRHEEVAAEAATFLVFVAGDVQMRFEVAEIWSRHAETILRRVGGQDQLWGWLFNNRGAMRFRQGRLAAAIADCTLALAAKQKAGLADSADVAISLANMGLYLGQDLKWDEALPYLERSVVILDRTFGPEHPRGAFMLSNLAEGLNELGRFPEARQAASRALIIFEREIGTENVTFTYPLTATGIAHLGEGDIEKAVLVLERAAGVCDVKDTDPAHLGEVHLALARALFAQQRDLPRARALVERARGEYERAPRHPLVERELKRLELLLSTHPSRRHEDAPELVSP